MKKVIALFALLVACRDYAESDTEADRETPVAVEQLTGNWCADDLCLEVSPTNYGAEWMIFNWKSLECQEGGFLQFMGDERYRFGAIFPDTGCYSRANVAEPYWGSFTTNEAGQLLVHLSVLQEPLKLTRQTY